MFALSVQEDMQMDVETAFLNEEEGNLKEVKKREKDNWCANCTKASMG